MTNEPISPERLAKARRTFFFRIFVLFIILGFGYNWLIKFLDDNDEKFLADTAAYEEKFKGFAQPFIEISKKGGPKGDSSLFSKSKETKPLLCYGNPDKHKRTIARLQHFMPADRLPQKIEEANPIVVINIKSDRVFNSGVKGVKYPIYDIYMDFIDTQKKVIYRQEKVMGDPRESDEDHRKVAPGVVPINEAELIIANVLGYKTKMVLTPKY
jgi:hypothetical protein